VSTVYEGYDTRRDATAEAVEREGVCTAHFLSIGERLSSAARHVPSPIPLGHVSLRTQDSSVTRPGDMGTSSTKVNGLLHCSTTDGSRRSRGMRGCAHVRTCSLASDSWRRPPAFVFVSLQVSPISTRSTSLRTNTRRGNADQRTRHTLLLCCAAARHLAVRADSLPRDDEAIATPRNARAYARPE